MPSADLSRGLRRAAVVATAAIAAVLISPAAAHASTDHLVTGTGGLGLAVRGGPSVAAARLDTLPEGTVVAIECQTAGDDVFGHPIWDRLDSGGYVSDWYVDTAGSGLPACPADPPPPAAADPPAEPGPAYNGPAYNGPAYDGPAYDGAAYDGAAAAQWAVAHAFDPPDYPDGDCVNFVSAALHLGGGLPTADWWYRDGRADHSASWTDASDFADQLAAHGYLSRVDIDPAASAIPGAAIGDVVLYDQAQGTGFNHVAIVVRIDPAGVVEVAAHTNAYDYRVWNQSYLDLGGPAGYGAQLLRVVVTVP